MGPRISLLLPTLGRPVLARNFLQTVVEQTENLDDVEVILYVNDDDPTSQNLDDERINLTRIIGPPATMGTYNTSCLEHSQGRVLVLVNDDILIRTRSWDRILLELDAEFEDGIYLAYGNDLFKKEKVSTFPILSRRTCEILITPYPKQYRGGLIDYHLFDIFMRLQKLGHDRIRYLAGVIFEHIHYRTGKMTLDATYTRRGRWDDDATFIGLRNLRDLSAQRLLAAIENRKLPETPQGPLTDSSPSNFLRAVFDYYRAFLCDGALPMRWRSFLFAWYCGRYLARKGYLGALARS